MDTGNVFRVILSSKAKKYIQGQDNKFKERVERALTDISKNPFNHPNISKMRGRYNDQYRYRFGDYRIVYRIIKDEIKVLVIEIGPRGGVYK